MNTNITADKLLEQIDALCESGAEAMPDGERLTALIVRSRLLAERYRSDSENGFKVQSYNRGIEAAIERIQRAAAATMGELTEKDGFAYWIAKAKERLLDDLAFELDRSYTWLP